MAKRYAHRKMSAKDLQEFEQILFEQMDLQRWFVVRVIAAFGVETIITLQ